MERLTNAQVISTLVILIPTIQAKSHVCMANEDFTIPEKVVYGDHNIPDLKEFNNATIRVKRQDTGGKYEEAAEMGILKIIQVIFQMLRNLFIGNPTGGASPWSDNVPKTVVEMFREKIGTILIKKKSKEQEENEKAAGAS